jgi:hypothetical protein
MYKVELVWTNSGADIQVLNSKKSKIIPIESWELRSMRWSDSTSNKEKHGGLDYSMIAMCIQLIQNQYYSFHENVKEEQKYQKPLTINEH